MRVRAWSTTISVWTQTSPSGCHSGSCGQPTSASSSGKSLPMTPSSSASRRPIDGRGACSSSFSISPQIRSAGRSSSGIAFAQRARVLVRACTSNRAANWTARSTRRLSSPNVRGSTARSDPRARRSRAPVERIEVLAGQRIERDRVDGEIAAPGRLLDRHRRIALDGEAAMAAAGLRVAARQRHVDAADLVDREALADRVDRTEPRQQVAQRIGGDAEHLQVDVLRRPAEQPIADPAADDQGAAAGRGRCAARSSATSGGTGRGHCSRRLPYLRTRPSAEARRERVEDR